MSEWQPAIIKPLSKIGCEHHEWIKDPNGAFVRMSGTRIRVRPSEHLRGREQHGGRQIINAFPDCHFWEVHPDDVERCGGVELFTTCLIYVD